MLELHTLMLRAGDPVIDHVFPDRAITVVLGANRSGKTLLCRIIAGLSEAATGRVVLDGSPLAAGTRRPVALVNQAFVNYPAWRVAENIASPLIARGVAAADRRPVVEDIAGKLGLDGLLDRFPHELSGGQQQRVAIGRALAKGARVLILDEPLVNLDYKLRESLRDELRALLMTEGMKSEGLTVIYTTTDPVDAFAMAHEVVLIEDHGFVQSGAPMDVYRHPRSFTAAALMSEPTVNAVSDGTRIAAIRPEHVRLQRPGTDSVRAFKLLVEEVETNGAHTFIHGLVGRDGWVVKVDGMVNVKADHTLPVWVRDSDILEFEMH